MENSNGAAIAALVLGIVSIVTAFLLPLVGLICGIVGVVLGAKTKNTFGTGKAGFIMSIIGIVLNVILWIISAIAVTALISLLS